MQQITDSELQREVEALKSHRRISVNRPILDPDLPDMAAIRGGGQEIMSAAAGGAAGGGSPVHSDQYHHRTLSSTSGSSTGSLRSLRSQRLPSETQSISPSPSAPQTHGYGVTLSDDGPMTAATKSHRTQGSGRQAFTAKRRGPDSAAGSSRSGAASYDSSAGAQSRSQRADSNASASSDGSNAGPSDPSHLFWVPASIHPEISPSHFRQFLQEHASRAVREGANPSDTSASPTSPTSGFSPFGVVSPSSTASTATSPSTEAASQSPISFASRQASIARRGSTLRRQYRPENDPEDDENTPGRKATVLPAPPKSREGEQMLSISDLQKLEQLAEEASKSTDENELRSVLRRTMSLGAPSSTMDTVDAVPPTSDDADAPIIVPPPGQILRRAARTKIRKSSMSGSDGERVNASRSSRRRAMAGQSLVSNAGSDSASEGTNDSGSERFSKPDLASVGLSFMQRRVSDTSEASSGEEEGLSNRPVSDGATESIVDAYSRDSFISDASQRTSFTSYNDTDLSDASAQQWNKQIGAMIGSDRQISPPTTPTQTQVSSQNQGGYFDLPSTASEHISQNLSVNTDAAVRGRNVFVESPVQSPDKEFHPTPASVDSSFSKPPPQSSWPVPVSHVPPVPSFEKTRRNPQQQQQQQQQQSQSQDQPPRVHQLEPASQLPQSSGVPSAPTQNQQQTPRAQTALEKPVQKTKEKEKKSGFASWFGIGKDEDDGRLSAKEERKRERAHRKEREREEEMAASAASSGAVSAQSSTAGPYGGSGTPIAGRTEKDKDKDKDVGSFLGALFGKKKGHDDDRGAYGRSGHDGQLTAGSLLDQRYSNGGLNRHINNYYRYPIHVERAVYRLSHIKLANPRRPLYEQVLISNLMFWYLSIVNKQQQSQQHSQQAQQQAQLQSAQQPSQQQQQVSAGKQGASAGAPSPKTVEMADSADVSTPPASSTPTELAPVAPSSTSRGPVASGGNVATSPGPPTLVGKAKKSSLVKPNRAPPSAGRSAETPILAAGYGAQHRQINSDLAQQQQQQQHGNYTNSPGGISVGQVIDPRALQYSYLLQQQQQQQPQDGGQLNGSSASRHSTSNGSSFDDGDARDGQRHSGSSYNSAGSSTLTSSPKTSPSINPQRMRGLSPSSSSGSIGLGTEGRAAELSTNSGAWLGGSRTNTSSSNAARDGGQIWNGNGQDYDGDYGSSTPHKQDATPRYRRTDPYASEDGNGVSGGDKGLQHRVPSAGSLSSAYQSGTGSGAMTTSYSSGSLGSAAGRLSPERKRTGSNSSSGRGQQGSGGIRSVSGPAYSMSGGGGYEEDPRAGMSPSPPVPAVSNTILEAARLSQSRRH